MSTTISQKVYEAAVAFLEMFDTVLERRGTEGLEETFEEAATNLRLTLEIQRLETEAGLEPDDQLSSLKSEGILFLLSHAVVKAYNKQSTPQAETVTT